MKLPYGGVAAERLYDYMGVLLEDYMNMGV